MDARTKSFTFDKFMMWDFKDNLKILRLNRQIVINNFWKTHTMQSHLIATNANRLLFLTKSAEAYSFTGLKFEVPSIFAYFCVMRRRFK